MLPRETRHTKWCQSHFVTLKTSLGVEKKKKKHFLTIFSHDHYENFLIIFRVSFSIARQFTCRMNGTHMANSLIISKYIGISDHFRESNSRFRTSWIKIKKNHFWTLYFVPNFLNKYWKKKLGKMFIANWRCVDAILKKIAVFSVWKSFGPD